MRELLYTTVIYNTHDGVTIVEMLTKDEARVWCEENNGEYTNVMLPKHIPTLDSRILTLKPGQYTLV